MMADRLAKTAGTEKLFYRDSHIKTFSAKVTACEQSTAAGQGGIWRVELDRTAFFPEGGGQYADTGWLCDPAKEPDISGAVSGVRVLDVREEDGHIYHMTEKPLKDGQQIEGRIDWEERFMKMQQHTGEHIVSGLVHSRFGYDNVGFHLGSTDCTMDFNGELTKEALAEIELEANRAVWKNLEVEALYPAEEELAKMEYRSKLELTGQVRIVVIAGYDTCACCAPHVKRTGEIGLIKLTDVQRYKGGARVTMLCGSRALSDYAVKQEQAKHISAMLCAKENETADAVRRLREECSSFQYELGEKEKEAALLRAEMVPVEEKAVCVFGKEISGDSMRTFMNRVLESDRKLCGVFFGDDESGYRYVIGSRTMNVLPVAKELNAAFDGRGGGKPEMAQGTVKGRAEDMREWILEKAGKI